MKRIIKAQFSNQMKFDEIINAQKLQLYMNLSHKD